MAACALGLALVPLADAAEITATINPAKARPNQVVAYTIVIKDGRPDAVPNLQLPLQIGQASAPSVQQNYAVINGVSSAQISITWGLAAQEPGDFVIAPQDVSVGGQIVKTNEVKFSVVSGGDAPGPGADNDPNMPILQIEVGKTEIYRGEVVPITATLYYPREVGLRRTGLIEIDKNDFAIQRFPLQSEQGMTVINGTGYIVQTFRSTISALKEGDLKAGPATMDIIVEVPIQGNFSRNPFFGVPTEPRRLTLKSQEVPVKVLPLPKEGRPASFSGAVGEFTLNLAATPTDVKVGDPISVELTVSGTGNFDALTPPALSLPDGWRTYPARRYNVDSNGVDPNLTPTLERRLGFSSVIVPEKEHTVIPPFEISYFSPEAKKYVTLKTDEVAVVIHADRNVAAATTSNTAGATSTTDSPPQAGGLAPPQATLSDILVHTPAMAHWISPSAVILTRRPIFWIATLLPAIAVLIAGIFKVMRRRLLEAEKGPAGDVRRAWRDLNAASLNDETFLQRAAQFIHTVHADRDDATRAAAVDTALKRYLNQNFSQDRSASSPLTSAERGEILSALDQLRTQTLEQLSQKPQPAHRRLTPGVAAMMLGALALSPDSTQAAEPTPDELYQQAVEALKNEDFTRAQYIAEALTRRQPPQLSSELFQLIGHARFKKDDLGRAALWYERAALFSPREAELKQNLRLLDEKTRFLLFTPQSPLEQFSLNLSHNEWIMIGIIGFWLILVAIILKIWKGQMGSPGGIMVALGITLMIASAGMALVRPSGSDRVKDVSIVTVKDTRAYSAAAHTASEVIELPPGSQVRILDTRGSWNYVEIPRTSEGADILRGWVDTQALTPFWPWDPVIVP